MRIGRSGEAELVHPLHVDALDDWAASMSTTFLQDPSGDRHRRFVEMLRVNWDAERNWGVQADGHWVGTLGSSRRTLTVPTAGGPAPDVPADGLTFVTVAGTHRRRGLLTAMLSDSLRAARERGDVVSVLWAAEWPIYGRFGYAPASLSASYTLRPRVPGGSVEPTGKGTIRQVDRDEAGALAPSIFRRAAAQRAGNVDRPDDWWQSVLRLGDYRDIPPGGPWPNAFVREGPDGPDGFVAWTASRDFDIDGSSGALEVADLCAANDAAYRDLWAYLTGIDLVDEITLGRRPVDEPVRWLLTDGRALRQTYAGDGLWLRILDLPAALSARRYAVPDRLTFEVVDDDIGGFASGRYVLDGGPDGASCAPSTVDSADLRVHQRALAGAYLGGFSLRGRSVAGGVDELTPGALRRADAMFATPLAPWCATGF